MEDDVRYTARDRQEPQNEAEAFSRELWSLIQMPGAIRSTERTLTLPLRRGRVGTETFIVQTYRHPKEGELLALQRVSDEGTTRLIIPPEITEIIARQREQVSKKLRSGIAKRTIEERKSRGEVFGFQKKKDLA